MNAKPVGRARRARRFFVALLVLVAVYAGYRYTLYRLVQSKLDKIRLQGYPVTLAELDAYYPTPPPGQNAADLYLEAFQHFAPHEAVNTNLPIVDIARPPARGEPMSEVMRNAVSAYLTTNAEWLALLHRAAVVQQCRYPINLRDGFLVRHDHYVPVRQSARLLALEVLLRSDNRDETAASSVIASLALARSLKDEPLLISQLVRIACQSVAVSSLEGVLSRTQVSSNQLVNLSQALADAEDLSLMTRGYVGDRCIQNDAFEQLASGKITPADAFGFLDQTPLWAGPAFLLYRASGLLEIDHITLVTVVNEVVEASKLAPPDELKTMKSLENSIRGLPFNTVISHMVLPGLPSISLKCARSAATLRTARLAIAVERFRLARGELSGSLAELLPAYLNAVPQDPFDGQPLRYKKLEKGYLVYSIGEDGNDDGGDEKKDITFTVER